MNKREKGFTLLELAVVLTVVALIAGSGLAVASAQLESQKIEKTENTINEIFRTMDLFFKKFCYLPCPANLEYQAHWTIFGHGRDSGTGTCSFLTYNYISDDVLAGMVPVSTLQLPTDMVLDGWGRKLYYIIDEEFTSAAGISAAVGDIEIVNKVDSGSVIASDAAVLIMSKGTNGEGAWPIKAAKRINKLLPDEDEEENNWNGGYVTHLEPFDKQFVQKFRTSTFDDIVVYRAKWQLPIENNPNCP